MQIEDGSSNPLPLPQIKREKNRTMNQTLGIQKFIVQLGSLDAKKKKRKKKRGPNSGPGASSEVHVGHWTGP